MAVGSFVLLGCVISQIDLRVKFHAFDAWKLENLENISMVDLKQTLQTLHYLMFYYLI